MIIRSLFLLFLFLIALLQTTAEAQEEPQQGYPRYRIYGQIDLRYLEYDTKSTLEGNKSESHRKYFEQTYRLGITGFVVNRKLLVYSAETAFKYWTNNNKNDEDNKTKERTLDFSLSTTFLPRGPISLDLYASRSSGVDTEQDVPFDSTSISYGAALRVFLNDLRFLKKRGREGEAVLADLPTLTFNYDHWDFTSDTITHKIVTDRFAFTMKGRVNSIRTQYAFEYEFMNFSFPDKSYDSQRLGLRTLTVFSPGKAFLTTDFQYYVFDVSKTLFVMADLQFTPTERFSHGYTYNYFGFDIDSVKSSDQNLDGRWSYWFTKDLFGTAAAYYGRSSTDGLSENGYGTKENLGYTKMLGSFRLNTDYSFSYQRTTMSEEIMSNTIRLNLATTKLKWARAYADYAFSYETISRPNSPSDSFVDNSVTTGIDGRGPGRFYWKVEGQYHNRTGNGAPGQVVIIGGAPAIAVMDSQYYSVLANVGYPLLGRGSVEVEGYYSAGTADGSNVKRFYYSAKVNLRLLRNLSLFAQWRDEWDKVEAIAFDTRIKQLDARIYYRLGRTFLSLEYTRAKQEEGPATTDTGRLYLKLTRWI